MTFAQAKAIIGNKGTCFYTDNDGGEHEMK